MQSPVRERKNTTLIVHGLNETNKLDLNDMNPIGSVLDVQIQCTQLCIFTQYLTSTPVSSGI